MIFFTSDCHFGHENILKLCSRPFDSVKEMNEALIANWNQKVKGNDTVYILGDMFYRYHGDCADILRRLKGKKRLVLGNHDTSWTGRTDLAKYFLSVEPMQEVSVQGRLAILCHYPLVTWKKEQTSLMIHGHIHNDTARDFWPLLAARENVLNAGCEVNGYAPVTLDELMENNRTFKAAHI